MNGPHPYAPYHEARLPKERAAEWLLRLSEQFASPVIGPVLQEMNATIDVAIEGRRARLKEIDWSSWDALDVAALVDAALAIDEATRRFLPGPWRARAMPAVERFLFRQFFIVHGLGRALDDPTEPFGRVITLPLAARMLLPAARVEFARLAGAAARQELLRRGEVRSEYFTAAMILYLMRAPDERGRSLLPSDVAAALGPLVKKIGVNLVTRARLDVHRIPPSEFDLERLTQLFETLATVERSWRGPEILARGLEEGALDILPVAAALDFKNRARRAWRQSTTPSGERDDRGREGRQQIESLDDDATAGNPDKIHIRIVEDSVGVESWRRPDEALERLEVRGLPDRFLAEHPRHRAGLALLLGEESLTAAAKRLGVSVAAVSKRRTAAEEAFRAWARRRLGLG